MKGSYKEDSSEALKIRSIIQVLRDRIHHFNTSLAQTQEIKVHNDTSDRLETGVSGLHRVSQ